jgi:RNA polymerase sigma-70 factor (ECF subfamily)
MYNTSLRILNNSPEAEDVMQDSFLDAFGKIDSYSGEGSFGGWLKRIIVNNSLDALKKQRDLVSIEESKIEMEDNQDTYAENIDFKVEEVKSAMKSLSEDDRVIISLFLFEGYDHEEISQVLKISNNTSRTRFSRAKSKLLKILTEQRSIKMFHPN